jgi:hypothetical protein
MIVLRRPPWHAPMARMSSQHGSAAARARAAERSAGRSRIPVDEPTEALSEEELLAERMSFFESSYELHAGLEVRESSWSEALDICPDSGWPPLPPLPLPPRTRHRR